MSVSTLRPHVKQYAPLLLSVILIGTLSAVGIGARITPPARQDAVWTTAASVQPVSHNWRYRPLWGVLPPKPIVGHRTLAIPHRAPQRLKLAHIQAREPSSGVAARIRAAWPGPNDDEAVAVASCESGLNPNEWSGPYYGLFQMDASFRRSYGAPVGSSVETQTRAAYKAYSGPRGWGPWPNCGYARFGLR